MTELLDKPLDEIRSSRWTPVAATVAAAVETEAAGAAR